jgi:hypothetical protein
MTVQLDGAEVMQAIEVAAAVGGIVLMLIAGLVFYLLVRPPRHARKASPAEPDAIQVDEMLRLLDRMEQRLAVVERAVGDENRRDERILETGEEPGNRRIK